MVESWSGCRPAQPARSHPSRRLLLRCIHPSNPGRDAHGQSSRSRLANHDVAAGGYSELAGAFAVVRIRIGNMDRPIKLAMLIPAIENISAFWGSMIALSCLCADRVAAEGHLDRDSEG